VSKTIFDLADEAIKIPMLGKTESLNASVATGVVLYEYVRQKSL
jgi:tRNA G18 (ribose-2'-O)-methylase SpoU